MLKHVLSPLLAAGTSMWNSLSNAAGPRFQIVILHHVPQEMFPSLCGLLDMIKSENGFLTPDAAVAMLNCPVDPKPDPANLPCLLTFDDGFDSAVPIVRDILPRYGAKAVFFVCPGLVDLSPEAQESVVLANVFRGAPPHAGTPRLMTWEEIEAVRREGHEIGAHGAMHLRLSEIAQYLADAEIVQAGKLMIDRLGGSAPSWYAYAFGDIASISAQSLKTILSHYPYCRSGIRGSNGPDNVAGVMTAQEINLAAPAHVQKAILGGAYDLRYVAARNRLRAYSRMAAE